MYDYEEMVYIDCKNWIKEHIKRYMNNYPEGSKYDISTAMQNDARTADSITGNDSGSYTCNSYKAEENLVGNWGLLQEALIEFGEEGIDILDEGAEWCDVTIRCYILGQVFENAFDDVWEDMENNEY